MAGGPAGERPAFRLDAVGGDIGAALRSVQNLAEASLYFDYRRPDSGATDDERSLVDAFMEQVLDTYDVLTENQRQAMIDWLHWKDLHFRNDLRVAANIEVQQAFGHLLHITNTTRHFESDTLRLQRVRGLPSDDEMRQMFEAEFTKAQPVALEMIESLKWEGILDENSQPRTVPVSYTHLTLPTKRIV